MSLFGLDERQGDGSCFKGVNALSRACFFSTLGETGLSKTLGDAGLLVGIGLMRTVSPHCAILCLYQVGSSCFCCSSYCTGGSHIFDVHRIPGWTDLKGMALCR